MLTAHQRIQIARHLPEVIDAHVSEMFLEVIELATVRLTLDPSRGDQIDISWQNGSSRVRRSRLLDDYSDDIEVLPIEPDLRRRLVLVFGHLEFWSEE